MTSRQKSARDIFIRKRSLSQGKIALELSPSRNLYSVRPFKKTLAIPDGEERCAEHGHAFPEETRMTAFSRGEEKAASNALGE